MKHPSHGVVALILTENPDGDCPEFDVKVEGKVVSCRIHGVPGLRWYIGCFFDRPKPTATSKCIYYIYESYLEGILMDGPLGIDRSLQSNRTRLSPDRNSNIEMFFFLPAKFNGKHVNGYFQPNSWLIELKVYESDEYFDLPNTGRLSLARSIILGRKETPPKFDKFRDHGAERLIVHYKWQYYCMDLTLEILPGSYLGQKNIPERHRGKITTPCTKRAGVEESPISIPIGNTVVSRPEEYPGSLPEYYWGPLPKSPPAWGQKGENFGTQGVRSERGRSPLGKRISDAEGSAVLRQPVALQEAKVYGERPMLPILPPRQSMKYLPVGWELRYTNTWRVYYVNHRDRYTTWQNPLEEESGVLERAQPDHGREAWSDEGGQLGSASTRLQRMNEMVKILWEERAHAEANIQRFQLGYAYPTEWRNMNIEHWFPEDEASEPIIEHIHIHNIDPRLFWRAFRVRNTTITRIEALEKARDELEDSMSSNFLVGLTTEWDEANRGKKRSSEELEENDNREVPTGGEQIDYREDYGPEVPLTRDGKIDPDWHRDKMIRFGKVLGTKLSNSLEEYNEGTLSWYKDQVPILVADSPPDHNMDDDDALQEAIKQSLQQYNIDLQRQTCESTNELSKYVTEESSYGPGDYGHPPLRNVSQQRPSERDDPNDDMGTNGDPISRKMSKVATNSDQMNHDMKINPVDMRQAPQLLIGVDCDMGCESELEADTLVDAAGPGDVNLDIQGDSRDNPMSNQVSQPLEMEDTENDSALYTPPPWYWLVRFGQMCQSPPKPVLVLRGGGRQVVSAESATAISCQVLLDDQGVHNESSTAPSDGQDIQDTVPAGSSTGQPDTLAVAGSAEVLNDGHPAEPAADGRLADELETDTSARIPMVDLEIGSGTSGLARELDLTRSNTISGTGASTSIISSERTYNLGKRNPKS